MKISIWTSSCLKRRSGLAFIAISIALLIGLGVRVALLVKSAGEVSWDPSLVASFFLGELFDAGSAAWWAIPLVLLLASLPRNVFTHTWARILAHVSVFLICFLLL
ncbi:MAG: hypothetical protein KAX37_11420, partial [Opitutaceae bacterium]|nr:hypothetical protein [Opitutaceae bacterium]